MNEWLWFLSRATGVVSIVLLTAVVVLGAMTAGRWTRRGDRAGVVMVLHRWLGLGMVAFLGTHVLTAIVETYVSIGWLSAVVPFTSGYSPVWVGLGTLAVDLFVAVAVTSYFRHRLSEQVWHRVHLASYALWPLAIAHGITLGAADQLLVWSTTIGCAAIGAAALVWRLAGDHHDPHQRRLVSTQEWS